MTKRRTCLMCDQRFLSRGPDHRRCPRCTDMLRHRGDDGPEPRPLRTPTPGRPRPMPRQA